VKKKHNLHHLIWLGGVVVRSSSPSQLSLPSFHGR